MSARALLAAALVAGTALTLAPASATPDGQLPAPGCAHFLDDRQDAKPYVVNPVTLDGGNPTALPDDPALDITWATFRTTGTDLVAYVHVESLGLKTASGDGPRFEWSFTVNGKVLTFFTQRPDATAAAMLGVQRAVASASQGVLVAAPDDGGRVGTSYEPRLAVAAGWDTTRSLVVLGASVASIERVVGSIGGRTLTALTVSSKMLTPTGGTASADSAPATATTYAVGDNRCFGPAPGVLTNLGSTTVQYSDAAAVAARLTDATGHVLAGRTVTFAVGAATVAGRTGYDGVARASLDPRLVAGAYRLVMVFAGDGVAGRVESSATFTVRPETTVLTLSVEKGGKSRTVTAKLKDDDRTPLAGQTIVWYVDGAKVGTGTTSGGGMVSLQTGKPTHTVTAEFLAIPGRYLGATASRKVSDRQD